MKESLLIVAFFAAGILCGRFDLAPDFASSVLPAWRSSASSWCAWGYL